MKLLHLSAWMGRRRCLRLILYSSSEIAFLSGVSFFDAGILLLTASPGGGLLLSCARPYGRFHVTVTFRIGCVFCPDASVVVKRKASTKSALSSRGWKTIPLTVGWKVQLGFPARFSGWRGIGGCVWEGFGKMENEYVRDSLWWGTALSVASLRGDAPPT